MIIHYCGTVKWFPLSEIELELMKMRKYHQKRNNFKMCWNKRQMLCLVASQVSNSKFIFNHQFEKTFIILNLNFAKFWWLLSSKLPWIRKNRLGEIFSKFRSVDFWAIFVNLSFEGENGDIYFCQHFHWVISLTIWLVSC